MLYVTVAQGDSGIGCISVKDCLPNVFVLSSGGYGHVPLPLLGREAGLCTTELHALNIILCKTR